jgi:hypothetical protein
MMTVEALRRWFKDEYNHKGIFDISVSGLRGAVTYESPQGQIVMIGVSLPDEFSSMEELLLERTVYQDRLARRGAEAITEEFLG